MKKLKYFDRDKFKNEVHVLESKLNAYNEFLRIADKISPGAKSMDDIVKHVNGKTGFENPRMSADALLVLDDFNQLIALEAVWKGINFNALEPAGKNVFKIKEEHLEQLESLYKVYYPEEQAEQISILEKAIEMLNKLDMPYRASLGFHGTRQFWSWNKAHTDNNLNRTRRRVIS